MTPMMEQYFEVKNQYKDYLLFYRLGDFYEMFFDDAIVGSRELELTLTGRDCGEAERAPMCGIPFHSSESYIGRLIEKGYKVAICEQVEDPAQAKGLVRREVVRVITPGTLIESNLLTETKNNYIASVYVGGETCGICFADISTARIYATSFRGAGLEEKIQNELGTYAPRELILNIKGEDNKKLADFFHARREIMLSDNQYMRFDYPYALELVKKQFSQKETMTLLSEKALVCAVGALLDYIADMQKSDISYIKDLSVYSDGQYMAMDLNTRRNLEICETMRSKEKRGSLLWALDKTETAAGARLLRQWIEHPLLKVSDIVTRQDAVEELFGNYMLREEIIALLSGMLDLERLVTKIIYGTANGKDLRAVSSSIAALPAIRELLGECRSDALRGICEELDTLEDLYRSIDETLVEDPPFSVREGGMIADGHHKDIDYLRSVMTDGKSWIEKIAAEEREKTGIKTLKIAYNRVFGYYIEVTRSLIGQVPDRYIRKQTLSNCERYITQELKDLEATILGATEKVCSLEYEVFQQLREYIAQNSARIQKTAALISELDVFAGLATVAVRNRYVRPEVDNGGTIEIKDGRHPVVEQFVKDSYFVPNDTLLDGKENRIMLITGPNMAGKSTYMRQVALITVMAQIGSFVPAAEAKIGVVDKVFTRVGASDDLASGQSTFMLEMNEVAYILKNATAASLIIYDEVGRGTSTFDGMSIARAIVEYTNGKKIGAKTLFATHYHELTVLEDEMSGIVNYNVVAKKRGDDITFLRKIVRGSTDDSYGIEVAKLAGLPSEVIKRAKDILAMIESGSHITPGKGAAPSAPERDNTLISLDDCIREQIAEEIKLMDLNTLTPYEAIGKLFDFQRRLK